ncbi:NADH-quinone oxidoreductase subunit NuoN [Niveispirillum cyanobacteriorum]|uniref:NADH-quinone oxidoreductase subunit N n=1 Tax=Niveispirillum cyanobacteriorum TaxID=1612173 RepID=A0A2K9N778_9PROT|nr:NADH-quinone oxidoreductase subunit NuoN [Niveispirillum cyanobacteriorum]AUN28957.1 NADH-quinone oxidoreductase subunit NuoN [Niveispirillum cyanobacteriorum]GGE68803.1 NADH-quinone oxidoreductase subunit N [Niveispirillum cyanobacteriorum]
MATFPDLAPALPEIFLACASMALLMIGVFRGEGSLRLVSWLTVASFIATGFLLLQGPEGRAVTFNGLFVSDSFGTFAKLLILIASSLAVILSVNYLEKERVARFEYPVLIALATLGMLAMVSANDLISLYVGLELQSLALYVIASFKRDVAKSTEAGLKYFVLGALSSGLLLYGASLVYGFAGTTSFDKLAAVLEGGASVGVVIGMVFVAAGLAFKISAVPFHMWTPDVYEGAPTSVTAFFAVAPKVAAITLFIRVLVGPFGDLAMQWQQVIQFCAGASMIIGALGAIQQKNIKRLMAYSSIGHIGYALVGLSAGSEEGVRGVLIYMAIYLAMNVGVFAVILSMRQSGRAVEEVADLAGLSKTHPMLAFAMAVFMWSLAGVPPAAGFWGKWAVFLPAIQAGLYPLAIVGVIASGISCFYYLRVIKAMYFDDVTEPLDRPTPTAGFVVAGAALFVFPVYIFFLSPITSGAAAAAAALFGAR